MPDFTIQLMKDFSCCDSVCLAFMGKNGMLLSIKNVKFIPIEGAKADMGKMALYAVTLGPSQVLCYFEIPNPKTLYKEMQFEISEKGKKGWLVTVDLNLQNPDLKKPKIDEAPYQIL